MATTLYIKTLAGIRRYTGGITEDGFMDDGTPIEEVAPWVRSESALTDAQALAVFARYTRRGGLDINPFRSSGEFAPPANIREIRQ